MGIIVFIILAVILILVFKKYGKQINAFINQMTGQAAYENNMDPQQGLRDLAHDLGFSLEENSTETNDKIYQQGGGILSGKYKGHDVKVVMTWKSQDESSVVRVGFSYSIDKRIVIRTGKSEVWSIVPKAKNQANLPTEVESFDNHLDYLGSSLLLAPSQIEKIAKYEWIHLVQKEGELTFIDDYAEWIQKEQGNQAMMGAIHPIWKKTLMEGFGSADQIKNFLDDMLSLS